MTDKFNLVLTRFSEELYSDPLDLEEEVMITYFAGAAKEYGYDTRVIDFHINSELDLAELIQNAPDLIAVCVRQPGTNLGNSISNITAFREHFKNVKSHITLFITRHGEVSE